MNLGSKQDLDSLLARWAAPVALPRLVSEQDQERAWDERADAIVKAALARNSAPGEELDALLLSPALAPEPGEVGVMLLAGEKKMAQEKEPATSPPPERKRTSLKEIAARASQSGSLVTRDPLSGSRPGTPSTAPPSIAPSRPSTAPPVSRPTEAGKEDSGVINLDVVRSSVTAQQVAAAEKAKPGQAGLFDDDKPVVSAAGSAEPSVAAVGPASAERPRAASASQVAAAPVKRSNTGAMMGAAIAVLGLAAAFAIVHRKQPDPVRAATQGVSDLRPVVTAAGTAAATGTPSPIPTPVAPPASVEPAPAPSATVGTDAKPADPGRVALGPSTPAAGAGTPAPTSGKEAPAELKTAAKDTPAAGGPPGDLKDEMARAVGPSKDGDKSAEVAAVPEPASGGGRNQNIPEQPSQGSVQAAVGAVMGGAKGCVAGADAVSRAQVTFSSQGVVASVSVTGWAADHGKSSCVQAALKGAKVGPFSKSSFTVPVSIRP